MSRLLSELLQAPEPTFSQTLSEFEAVCGRPGVDIKLANSIAQKVKQKARELGLDPQDSTGEEYYYSLQKLIAQHDAFLAKALHVSPTDDPLAVIAKITTSFAKMPVPRMAWLIKPSVARRLLKEHPPKRLLKQYGYRSLDSMLKRQSVAQLFVGAKIVESAEWYARLVKSYRKLTPQDFETRPVEVVTFSPDQLGTYGYEYVVAQRNHVVHVKEVGAVGILPMPVSQMRGLVITTVLLALHHIDEIRAHSTLFKLRQVTPNFGDLLVHTLLHDADDAARLVGRPIHWRAVRWHFGRDGVFHPEVFQPHVQPEDLYWQNAEKTLYNIEPALAFWDGLSYVGGLFDKRPVSFNILDNAISYCNGLVYGQQSIYHYQNDLWNQLILSYLGEKRLETDVVAQLEHSLSAPGLLPMLEEEMLL